MMEENAMRNDNFYPNDEEFNKALEYPGKK